MTNYATPCTPADACDRLADELAAMAKAARKRANIADREAQAYESAEQLARLDASRYRQHQPTPTPPEMPRQVTPADLAALGHGA